MSSSPGRRVFAANALAALMLTVAATLLALACFDVLTYPHFTMTLRSL